MIAVFGVGKNMVASMRHWAKATGVIVESESKSVRTTELGRPLFGPNGIDPYVEHPTTLWLIHWQLAARPDKTTWFWAFNHYSGITFERDGFIGKLARFARDRNWSRAANATIRNDVACFIRTYVARQPDGRTGHDDALESPITELGLIKAIGRNDGFRFARGPKTTLGDGVFTYALIDFWSPTLRTRSRCLSKPSPIRPAGRAACTCLTRTMSATAWRRSTTSPTGSSAGRKPQG